MKSASVRPSSIIAKRAAARRRNERNCHSRKGRSATAAKHFGARGVGIEIEGHRVLEARAACALHAAAKPAVVGAIARLKVAQQRGERGAVGGRVAHVRGGGRDWLFDCGNKVAYERLVLPYLRTRGVNRLDGLLLTHGDVQHLGGAATLLDDFRPRVIVDSVLRDRSSTRKQLHTELARRGLGKALVQRGDLLRLNPGTTARVLYPPAGLARATADDKALVVQLETAGVRVLFLSDSGFATEQWLLENEPDLRSDIVITGQHARDLSGTLDFLARVHPRAVVCSARGS
jgi:hypothetical protein